MLGEDNNKLHKDRKSQGFQELIEMQKLVVPLRVEQERYRKQSENQLYLHEIIFQNRKLLQ